MDFLDYTDVSMEYRGAMVGGRLKLTDEKLIFKPGSKSAKTETVERSQLELVNWQRLAGSWGIRVFTKDGNLHRFAGFKDAEKEKLAKFFKHTYDLDMLDKEFSVKGHNWGTVEFEGGVMNIEIGKAVGFEVPLPYVNQCVSGKNEATLEFHLNDDAAVNLSEMRFYIPGTELAGDDPVEAFREKVMSRASVVTTSGDAIAIFREISCLSPRGRYDIKIFPTYIHLHGKTFDYKIPSTHVQRLFLLPHKDQRQMHFAVNLDPPLKQGQTRYHFLVFNFKMEDEEDIELPFTDEEVQEKFEGKLEREMSGPTHDLLSKIIKAVVNKKITKPDTFKSHAGHQSVTCNHKAAAGFVYLLERGLIFIYKPPIFLRYDEIRSITIERSGGTNRSFDIKVTTIHDISYTFSSIEKNEYEKIYQFLKNKKVNVKSAGKGKGGTLTWDDGDKVDHYLEGVKRDAEMESDDNSMSSDDTDFNPDALEALSAKEEYDSEPSSTSSDSDGEAQGSDAEKRREERKKKKAEKAARPKKSSSGGGGERKTKKKKMTKIEGQPKRAMSAYFLWMNENRNKIKSELPSDAGIGDIAKAAGEKWKNMTEDDKSEWTEKAAEDKKRYEKEMEKWKSEGGEDKLKQAKKEAKKAAKAASGGSKPKAGPKSKTSPKKKVTESSAGSGAGFKSQEFIEDSDSSSGGDKKNKGSDSDSDDGDKKKASASSSDEDEKKKSSSDESMASGSDSD